MQINGMNSSTASHKASNQSSPSRNDKGLVAGPEICSQATQAEMSGLLEGSAAPGPEAVEPREKSWQVEL